jgi:hypothetical protein
LEHFVRHSARRGSTVNIRALHSAVQTVRLLSQASARKHVMQVVVACPNAKDGAPQAQI